eukprot:9004689-Pyramimonas_sp.AAC.1
MAWALSGRAHALAYSSRWRTPVPLLWRRCAPDSAAWTRARHWLCWSDRASSPTRAATLSGLSRDLGPAARAAPVAELTA